jgi:hypothetical protein
MEFKPFINQLIDNIDNNKTEGCIIPKKIDLILDGGAFNGCFELGVLLYLKELESTNRIKIKRVSGTSVGSILGLLYLLNQLDVAIDSSFKLWENYKSNLNLNNFKTLVYETINKLAPYKYKYFNNKLYITYYNYKTKKKIIKHKYKNNNDVAESIIRSAFVPYLMDGNFSYNNHVDGISPYIFKPRTDRKILFVYLASTSIIKLMCNIKYERNANGRMLSGIIDINKFLTTGNSTMCSYMNNWGIIDLFTLKMRDFIWIFILFIYDILMNIYSIVPECLFKNNILLDINKMIIRIIKDKLIYCMCI